MRKVALVSPALPVASACKAPLNWQRAKSGSWLYRDSVRARNEIPIFGRARRGIFADCGLFWCEMGKERLPISNDITRSDQRARARSLARLNCAGVSG